MEIRRKKRRDVKKSDFIKSQENYTKFMLLVLTAILFISIFSIVTIFSSKKVSADGYCQYVADRVGDNVQKCKRFSGQYNGYCGVPEIQCNDIPYNLIGGDSRICCNEETPNYNYAFGLYCNESQGLKGCFIINSNPVPDQPPLIDAWCCQNGQTCGSRFGECRGGGGSTSENCTNGVDDDNDGYADRWDPDCRGSSNGLFGGFTLVPSSQPIEGYPQITYAEWQPANINFGDNVRIFVELENVDYGNKVNITVYKVQQPDMMVEPIISSVDQYNNINIEIVDPASSSGYVVIDLNQNAYSAWLNGQNSCYDDCYFYFVAEMSDNDSIFRISNHLQIYPQGQVLPPTVNVLQPYWRCDQSGQQNVCCIVNGDITGYYDGSKAIWHNATIRGTISNWHWYSMHVGGANVQNPLNENGQGNNVNITHVYNIAPSAGTQTINYNYAILNATLNVSNSAGQASDTSDNFVVSNCLGPFPPLVKIVHPRQGGSYNEGPIDFKAIYYDYDTSPSDLTFSWIITYSRFANPEHVITCSPNNDPNCPNITVNLDPGNYIATLVVSDNIGNLGFDKVSFRVESSVIPYECYCTDPRDQQTPCESWNPDRNVTGNERLKTYCGPPYTPLDHNAYGTWQNYCTNNSQCPQGAFCNYDNQCQWYPSQVDCSQYYNQYACSDAGCLWDICISCNNQTKRQLGCSAYGGEYACKQDVCGLGYPLASNPPNLEDPIPWGCKWDEQKNKCVQRYWNPGPGYTCTESNEFVGDCSSGEDHIYINHSFKSDPPGYDAECCQARYGDDRCKNNNYYLEQVSCPQAPSVKMPGFSWVNVVAVLLLLGIYYALILKKDKEKAKGNKEDK